MSKSKSKQSAINKNDKKTDTDHFVNLMVEIEKKSQTKPDLSENLLDIEPGVGEILKEVFEKSSKNK
jgi:predicted  nucleic acid-binding Zn-ribbon protein